MKRRRKRLNRRLKSLENQNSLKENQLDQSESKQQEETMNNTPEKVKEILAERQAKKAAKQQVKKNPAQALSTPVQAKKIDKPDVKPVVMKPLAKTEQCPQTMESEKPQVTEKARDQVLNEREVRKLAKQAAKKKVDAPVPDKVQQNQFKKIATPTPAAETKAVVTKQNSDAELASKMVKLHIIESDSKAKPTNKAERRAIQEAQRAAKAKALEDKNIAKPSAKKPSDMTIKKSPDGKSSVPSATAATKPVTSSPPKASALHKVKLFKHLYSEKCNLNINVNQKLHPAIIKVGLQYANDTVVGSNARCYAFINAMKIVRKNCQDTTLIITHRSFQLINDYVTPPEKFFDRGLEAEIQSSVEFLQSCRPFAVSMTNALKYIKLIISQENSGDSDEDVRQVMLYKSI